MIDLAGIFFGKVPLGDPQRVNFPKNKIFGTVLEEATPNIERSARSKSWHAPQMTMQSVTCLNMYIFLQISLNEVRSFRSLLARVSFGRKVPKGPKVERFLG